MRLFDYAKTKYNSLPSRQDVSSSVKSWVATKYNNLPSRQAVSENVSKTIEQSKEALAFVRGSVSDTESAIDKIDGFARIGDPGNFMFYSRKESTRSSLNRAIYTNLVYALPVFTFEVFTYYFGHEMYDETQKAENYAFLRYATYLTAWAIKTGVEVYFAPAKVDMYIENAFNNGNVATTVIKDNPHINMPNHVHHKGCGCSGGVMLAPLVLSPAFYTFEMALLWATSKIISLLLPYDLGMFGLSLPIGDLLVLPGRAVINGRALAETNLGEFCAKHRDQFMNNSWAFGIGLAYQLVVGAISHLFGLGGVSSSFVLDPIAYGVFQIFTVAALLTKEMPGKKTGFDLLYYFHMGIAALLEQLSKAIIAHLNTESGGCDLVLLSKELVDVIPKTAQFDSLPSKAALQKLFTRYLLENKNLPIKSDSAYIVIKDAIFYLDKKTKTCINIDFSNEQYAKFMKALQLKNVGNLPTETAECAIEKLNAKQLTTITSILNHAIRLDWVKLAEKIAAFPPVNLSGEYLIDKKYLSIETAVRVPAIKLFLDLNGEMLRKKLEEITSAREARLPYLVQSLLDTYTPPGLEGTRTLLRVVLNDKLEPILKQLEIILAEHEKYQLEIRNKVQNNLAADTVKKIETNDLAKIDSRIQKADEELKLKNEEKEKSQELPNSSALKETKIITEYTQEVLEEKIKNALNTSFSAQPSATLPNDEKNQSGLNPLTHSQESAAKENKSDKKSNTASKLVFFAQTDAPKVSLGSTLIISEYEPESSPPSEERFSTAVETKKEVENKEQTTFRLFDNQQTDFEFELIQPPVKIDPNASLIYGKT